MRKCENKSQAFKTHNFEIKIENRRKPNLETTIIR